MVLQQNLAIRTAFPEFLYDQCHVRHWRNDDVTVLQPTNLRLALLSRYDLNELFNWGFSRVSDIASSDRRPMNFLGPRFPTNFLALVVLWMTSSVAPISDFLPMNLRRDPRLFAASRSPPSTTQLPDESRRQASTYDDGTRRLPMNLGRLLWSPRLNASISTDDSLRMTRGWYDKLRGSRRTFDDAESDATKTIEYIKRMLVCVTTSTDL